MQKELASTKVTILLYFIVLLLPFSFYFIYSSFETIKQDTKIVRQSSWISVGIEQLNTQADEHYIKSVENALIDISHWISQNEDSDLYIGSTTLKEDYDKVYQCWQSKKNELTIQCYDVSNDLAIVIEKMVYLKQKKIINFFYISLLVSMILILLTIYLVRTYIHLQMKKHAIHDHETHLYNKKYFLTTLESASAKSTRYKEPLSILWISLSINEQTSKKIKLEILNHFGELILEGVRTSDAPAKYYSETTEQSDVSYFSILLPYTKEEDSHILESRLKELLTEDELMKSNGVAFKFAVAQYEHEELVDVFIARSKSGVTA